MRLFNYTFEESQCLGVKCLNYPNILFYANHKKPQKFLVISVVSFLILIGNNADDGIDSAFHGF